MNTSTVKERLMDVADNGYLSAGGADNVAFVESKDSNAYDVTKEHLIWNVDEAAKMQPRYAQSIFNFQYDCMQPIKNAVQCIYAPKQLLELLEWINVSKYQLTEYFETDQRNVIRTMSVNNRATQKCRHRVSQYSFN